MRILFLCLLCICFQAKSQTIAVGDYGVVPNSFTDVTKAVQKAIEAARSQSASIIQFPAGRYDFWPENAEETHYYISNSSSETEVPVKSQRVGLLLKHLKNLTIEGNGSTFIFHGKMITWVIDSSENISIRNVRINYERPGMSEMTIKKITTSSVVAEIHPDSWFAVVNGKLQWYGEKWVAKNHHAVLVKPKDGMLIYSDWSFFSNSNAEVLSPRIVKFTGDFSKFSADSGDVLTIRDRYRDYVAVFQNRSKNISLQNVHMNSMHGLGIVSQFCENLRYDSVFIEPEAGSGRMIASSADGMHFSGCKGQITIDHCRFNGLHDDAVNVHGTHLKLSKIISPGKYLLRFMHHQTYGFLPFVSGDTVALLNSASLRIFDSAIVKSAILVGEREVLVEIDHPSSTLKVGDALENITWTPSLTIWNSRFERTSTRGILITTRRKVLIENNVYYRTGMHAILIENDASGWYESGPVMDVTIRNNQFIECGFNSFPDNYVIHINPQSHEKIKGNYVHRNIRIEKNLFKIYDYPLLSAYSVNGLSFIANKIEKSDFLKPGAKRPAIRLNACTGVVIKENSFSGISPEVLTENMSSTDLKSDIVR